jgi:hypothetical protein
MRGPSNPAATLTRDVVASRWTERSVAPVLAAIAIILFAWLAQRHVGESFFLADQVDQLQKYEAALRLEPEGLWGPAMSGTSARALGPFGALTFGLPVSLGLGIDAIHALTSLFLAIAAAVALWQLTRLDPVLGWTWFIVFISMRMVWWDAAMFWVNTLLLPLGLIALALCASTLRHPSATKVAAIAFVLLLALHVHLVALVGLPLLLIAAVQTQQRRTVRDGLTRKLPLIVSLTLIALAFIPYLAAEARTGFQNTRAIFSHVDSAAHATAADGQRAARETLVLAADPALVLPDQPREQIAVGITIALAALALMAWRRRSAMLWLAGTSILVVTGQALFFLFMARPLNGLHYAILLSPWYAIPPAVLVAALFPSPEHRSTRAAAAALGMVAIAVLVIRAPTLADQFAEKTPWNYAGIVKALDSLCAGGVVQTLEGPGLVDDITPAYDSVLQYLLKRGHANCRYDANAEFLIVAERSNAFDDALEVNGRRFVRERVLPPGLARYRRGQP